MTLRFSPFTRLVLGMPMALAVGLPRVQPRLKDPRQIIPAAGISASASHSARCVRSRSPSTPPNAPSSWSCTPGPEEFARLVRDGSFWDYATDSVGAIYAGNHTWRVPVRHLAARRDSIARALTARGLTHLVCPDSVQTPSTGDTRWLSLWRGPQYSALLYHRLDGDTAQLSVDVSPGVVNRCLGGT